MKRKPVHGTRWGTAVALVCFAFLKPVESAGKSDTGRPMGIKECIAYAMKNSPLLKEERSRVDLYAARKLQAVWAWTPKVSINSLLAGPTSRARLALDPNTGSRDPAITGSVALDKTSGDGELDYGDGLGIMWRFGIEAVMPLYTFGKLSSLENAADKGLEAAVALCKYKELELKRDIRKTYYSYQAARKTLSVLSEGAEKLEEAEEKVSESLDEDEDTYSQTDLFKLRVYGAELTARLAQAKRDVALAVEGMKYLIGWPGGRDLELKQEDLDGQEVEALADLDELLGLARRNNPAVAAAVAGAEAGRELVSYRRSFFFPDLYLAGGFNYSVDTAAQDIHHPFLSDSRNYRSVGAFIGLKWNLDVPVLLGKLKEAEADLEKAEARRRQALEGLSYKVKEGYLETKSAFEAVKAYKKAKKAGRSWLVSATLNWGMGVLDADDFIKAIKAYAVGELSYTKATLDYLKALAELDYRVGSEKGMK